MEDATFVAVRVDRVGEVVIARDDGTSDYGCFAASAASLARRSCKNIQALGMVRYDAVAQRADGFLLIVVLLPRPAENANRGAVSSRDCAIVPWVLCSSAPA